MNRANFLKSIAVSFVGLPLLGRLNASARPIASKAPTTPALRTHAVTSQQHVEISWTASGPIDVHTFFDGEGSSLLLRERDGKLAFWRRSEDYTAQFRCTDTNGTTYIQHRIPANPALS